MSPKDGCAHVLTLDGPAGVGKSSVASLVARRLGFFHLDTGAMYRAVTLAVLRAGIRDDGLDEESLRPIVRSLVDEGRLEVGGGGQVWIDGEDVSAQVRGAEVTALVSHVAALPVVRRALVALQRRLASTRRAPLPQRGAAPEGIVPEGIVVEGRDAGSHVFPDARWRFYLDATLEERARRRLRQLGRPDDDPAAVARSKELLAERDRIDSSRAFAPLCVPAGAIVLDTTGLDREAVVEAICREVRGGAP